MKVFFVCLGNICCSFFVEGVFCEILDVEIDSVGIVGWYVGKLFYGLMFEVVLCWGYDFFDLWVWQFIKCDFVDFDLIIGMDVSNIENIEVLCFSGNEMFVYLFIDYGVMEMMEVLDFYYICDFDGVLDLIECCVEGFKLVIC